MLGGERGVGDAGPQNWSEISDQELVITTIPHAITGEILRNSCYYYSRATLYRFSADENYEK